MICWFCRKEIEAKDIQSVEENSTFAAYGYCYCRNCMIGFRAGFEKGINQLQAARSLGIPKRVVVWWWSFQEFYESSWLRIKVWLKVF